MFLSYPLLFGSFKFGSIAFLALFTFCLLTHVPSVAFCSSVWCDSICSSHAIAHVCFVMPTFEFLYVHEYLFFLACGKVVAGAGGCRVMFIFRGHSRRFPCSATSGPRTSSV